MHSCSDVDECLESQLSGRRMCPYDSLCINTPGSYECGCPVGLLPVKRKASSGSDYSASDSDYTRSRLTTGAFDYVVCEDIDECLLQGVNACPNARSVVDGKLSQVCENVYAGHVCRCLPGLRPVYLPLADSAASPRRLSAHRTSGNRRREAPEKTTERTPNAYPERETLQITAVDLKTGTNHTLTSGHKVGEKMEMSGLGKGMSPAGVSLTQMKIELQPGDSKKSTRTDDSDMEEADNKRDLDVDGKVQILTRDGSCDQGSINSEVGPGKIEQTGQEKSEHQESELSKSSRLPSSGIRGSLLEEIFYFKSGLSGHVADSDVIETDYSYDESMESDQEGTIIMAYNDEDLESQDSDAPDWYSRDSDGGDWDRGIDHGGAIDGGYAKRERTKKDVLRSSPHFVAQRGVSTDQGGASTDQGGASTVHGEVNAAHGIEVYSSKESNYPLDQQKGYRQSDSRGGDSRGGECRGSDCRGGDYPGSGYRGSDYSYMPSYSPSHMASTGYDLRPSSQFATSERGTVKLVRRTGEGPQDPGSYEVPHQDSASRHPFGIYDSLIADGAFTYGNKTFAEEPAVPVNFAASGLIGSNLMSSGLASSGLVSTGPINSGLVNRTSGLDSSVLDQRVLGEGGSAKGGVGSMNASRPASGRGHDEMRGPVVDSRTLVGRGGGVVSAVERDGAVTGRRLSAVAKESLVKEEAVAEVFAQGMQLQERFVPRPDASVVERSQAVRRAPPALVSETGHSDVDPSAVAVQEVEGKIAKLLTEDEIHKAHLPMEEIKARYQWTRKQRERLVCVDVDECAEGSHKCPSDAACFNTYKSYECHCKDPSREFDWEQKKCVKKQVPERRLCAAQECHGPCMRSATNGYHCGCPRGYVSQHPEQWERLSKDALKLLDARSAKPSSDHPVPNYRSHPASDRAQLGGFANNGSKDSGSKDSGSKDSGSKDSGSKDSGSKDSGSKGNGSRGRVPSEPSEEEFQEAVQEAGGSCVDLDECALSGVKVCGVGCQCANTRGGFTCSCPERKVVQREPLANDFSFLKKLSEQFATHLDLRNDSQVLRSVKRNGLLPVVSAWVSTSTNPELLWVVDHIDWAKAQYLDLNSQELTPPELASLDNGTHEASQAVKAFIEYTLATLKQSYINLCLKSCSDCSKDRPCCTHNRIDCVPGVTRSSLFRVKKNECPVNTVQVIF
ncbi:calcium-binding EGF domain protein [Gregarina niphandrodes]|uniref:Calcium-binding EGF domain protein n=1 Tax=Gregarina niphandrodes TaxID=110365 RepID=A0A023B8H2_GRENI|nr:calcium-binding EGF domain protein [Gregarina niphandrodes]EZG68903.1 calcium-binding EGF domain protein [Gregarina niphandrodes]|eukprot:XP_011134527.1 calcium-binding EGF domain protein [Gregarina niphandrodes]